MFTDSIEDNVNILTDIATGMPRDAFARAQRTCKTLEVAIDTLRVEGNRDPAVAFGIIFCVMNAAKHFTVEEAEKTESLIHTL